MRILAASMLATALCLVPHLAWADSISLEQSACFGVDAGGRCDLRGEDGTCTDRKCERLDYSRWDGSGPPPTRTVDCSICDVEAGAPPSSSNGSSPSSGSSGGCSASAVRVAGSLALASLVPFALGLLARRRGRRHK